MIKYRQNLCGVLKFYQNKNKEFNGILREYCKQVCPKSTSAFSPSPNEANTSSNEAKPFKDIPSMGALKFLRKFIPGGEYVNYDAQQLLMAFKKELGPIYKLRGYFGRPDSVFTHNPDDFEQVLRNEGATPYRPTFGGMRYHRKVHRKDFFQGVEGLLSTQGEQWGTFRSAVNPILLKPQNVRMYLNKTCQVNKQFIERILELRDPHTFEVPDSFNDELNRWSLESISIIALDQQFGFFKNNRDNPDLNKISTHIRDFFTSAVDVTFKPPIWKFFKTKSFKKLMECQDGVIEVSQRYIEAALKRIEAEKREGGPAKKESDKSVLEKLIEVDKKIAIVMAADMLVVGMDATASAFAGLLLCLAKNPQKQELLRQEILKALPTKDSTFNENTFKNLPYLRACLKESMRVYPIFWGSSRKPVKDLTLSGYKVPKGTPIAVITTTLMKSETFYPKPEEFLPERWLRANELQKYAPSGCPLSGKPNPFIYLPFGYGARICIGRRIAEQELEVAAAYLVRNFHIEFNHSTENAYKTLFINVPNIPLKFKFTDVTD